MELKELRELKELKTIALGPEAFVLNFPASKASDNFFNSFNSLIHSLFILFNKVADESEDWLVAICHDVLPVIEYGVRTSFTS